MSLHFQCDFGSNTSPPLFTDDSRFLFTCDADGGFCYPLSLLVHNRFMLKQFFHVNRLLSQEWNHMSKYLFRRSPPAAKTEVYTTQPLRTAECSHECVTRLFDQWEISRCDICGRAGDLGWMFRCTKDTRGILPISDFDHVRHEFSRIDYADRPTTSSENSCAGSNVTSACQSSSSLATDYTSQVPDTGGSSWNLTYKSSEELSRDAGLDNKPRQNGNLVPRELGPQRRAPRSICRFKCCLSCRSNLRDRSWQSINTVVNEPLPPIAQHDLLNRPVSDARILINMDYRCKSMPNFHPYQPEKSKSLVTAQNKGMRKINTSGPRDVDYDADDEKMVDTNTTARLRHRNSSDPTPVGRLLFRNRMGGNVVGSHEKRMGRRLSEGRFLID